MRNYGGAQHRRIGGNATRFNPNERGSCVDKNYLTQKVPTEILCMIGNELKNEGATSALAALAYTCRKLNDIFKPALYEANVLFSGPHNELYAGHSAAGDDDFEYTYPRPVPVADPLNTIPLPAICWGAFNNSIDTMKKAIAAKADVNARAYLGRLPNGMDTFNGFGYPLHFAALAGSDEALTFLLDRGASLDTPSKGMCRCLSRRCVPPSAAEFEDPTLIWISLRGRYKYLPLHLALCHNKTSAAEILLNHRAPMAMYLETVGDGQGGFTTVFGHEAPAISIMASFGQESLVRLVADRASEGMMEDLVNELGDHKMGYPLNYAAMSPLSNVGTMKALVEFGALVDRQCPDSKLLKTPLMLTVRKGYWAATMALFDLGADVDGDPEDEVWRPGDPKHHLRGLIMSAVDARPKHDDDIGVKLWKEGRNEVIRRIMRKVEVKYPIYPYSKFDSISLHEHSGTTFLLHDTHPIYDIFASREIILISQCFN